MKNLSIFPQEVQQVVWSWIYSDYLHKNNLKEMEARPSDQQNLVEITHKKV